MARVTSEFWVAAYLRRANRDGVAAVLRRRGNPEAGAVYVKLDRLDGRAAVYGPAPQDETHGERRFLRLHGETWIEPADAERRLAREIGFDADIWIVEIEDRLGDPLVDLVALD